jgi:hypothetical protein
MALNFGARALVCAEGGWHHCRIVGVSLARGMEYVVHVRVICGDWVEVRDYARNLRVVCGRCVECQSLNYEPSCMRGMNAGGVEDLIGRG